MVLNSASSSLSQNSPEFFKFFTYSKYSGGGFGELTVGSALYRPLARLRGFPGVHDLGYAKGCVNYAGWETFSYNYFLVLYKKLLTIFKSPTLPVKSIFLLSKTGYLAVRDL